MDGVLGEEIQEETMGLFALAPGRFHEAAQDTVVFQPLARTGALDDSAHDGHGAQTSSGLTLGQGNLAPSKAGEEALLPL